MLRYLCRWLGCLGLCCCSELQAADIASPSLAPPVRADAAGVAVAVAERLAPPVAARLNWQLPAAAAERMEIIALPRAGWEAGGRRHHALRFKTEAVAHALQQLGWQVSQCETQARLPSRLSQTRGGINLDMALTLSVSCKY